MYRYWVMGIAVTLLGSGVSARTIRVPSEAPTIQAGIDLASDGDTVSVAPGQYSGPGNIELTIGGKKIVIAGESRGQVVINPGPEEAGFRMDQSGEGTSTVIAGFTIVGGKYGVFLNGSSPRLTGLTVRECSLGIGGTSGQSWNANPVLVNCRFEGDTVGLAISGASNAVVMGGSFDSCGVGTILDYSSIAITGSTFRDNATGIMSFTGSDLYQCRVDSAMFLGNETAIAGDCEVSNSTIGGGNIGIALPNFGQAAAVDKCTLENIAGAALATGAEEAIQMLTLVSNPGFALSNSVIRGCGDVARIAVAFEDAGQHLEMDRCLVTGNNGGISLTGADVTLLFIKSLYAENGSPVRYASRDHGRLLIDGATIARNGGDGINMTENGRPVRITNSIVAANVGIGIRADSSIEADTIVYSDIYGNIGGNFTGIENPTGFNGNISADPLFVGGAEFDYHLSSGSPAIDVGDPEGPTDPDGSRIDMGAFHFSFKPGDANGNGAVNGVDVLFLVAYLKNLGPPPRPLLAGDANGDCFVGGSDVVYLVNYFKGRGQAPRQGGCGDMKRIADDGAPIKSGFNPK